MGENTCEHGKRNEQAKRKCNHYLEQDKIEELFHKQFKFSFDFNWKLPNLSLWFNSPAWKNDDLQKLKDELNRIKSQLDNLDLEVWSAHTRKRNQAGDVSWYLRSTVKPEFLTQAWTKFYESVYTYKMVPETALLENKLVSLHLCEAPGAFISSLNHYLKLHHKDIQWEWRASTLNPYYEGNSPSNMINDDRFMFYTLDHWDFGIDNTGNLMDWDNSQEIIKNTQKLGKILLVTADGSIDCMERPDEQEDVTSALHYCEIVTALQALSSGGNLLFKLFTMFEHSTVSLLYLVNNLFEEVNIYKPVTSKQGNSEVYCVCLNLKNRDTLELYIPILKLAFGTNLYRTHALFPSDAIPPEFFNQVKECAEKFKTLQSEVIENNLVSFLYGKLVDSYSNIKNIKMKVARTFITHYDIKRIGTEDEILKGLLNQEIEMKWNMQLKRQGGSYTERITYRELIPKDKVKELIHILETDILSQKKMFMNNNTRKVKLYDPNERLNLKLITGSPIQKLNSSQFICSPILKFYLKIVSDKEFRVIILQSKTFNNLNNNTLVLPDHDFHSDFSEYELECFNLFFHKVCSLKEGDNLCVQNIHLLTQFTVSIVYVLALKNFEQISFVIGEGIYFENYKKNHTGLLHMEYVLEECVKFKKKGKSVLSSIPVKTTNIGELYEAIVLYNNTIYSKKCKEILSDLANAFKL